MSTLAVDVVRSETVKPSAPTPPHLSTLVFSAMDQHEAQIYMHKYLFYSPPDDDRVIDRLKKSLSETLTLFYPFAGRIVDNRYVDCNDKGVEWLEARVNAEMTEFLADPAAEDLVRMQPSRTDVTMVLSVQVNVFACGGVALGVRLAHQVFDLASMVFFVRTWASVTRGAEIVRPKFCAPSLFPPADIADDIPPFASSLFAAGPKLTSKRFVFTASHIAALQSQCPGATRALTVMSHLWRSLIVATTTTSASTLFASAMGFAVNLRNLMDLPLSSSYMGNLALAVLATSNDSRPTLLDLASRVQASKQKIDTNYVRKLQVDQTELLEAYATCEKVFSEVPLGVMISSFCRTPIYDADFGWGEPQWVTFLDVITPNLILLMDTKCGTGIQAWITLDEQQSNVAKIMEGLKLHRSPSRI